MKKRNIFTIILDTVFIIAFNVLFFLTRAYNIGTSIWVCYGFLHFSYFMILITPFLEAKGKTSNTSKLTTYGISICYFLVELIFILILYSKNFDKPVFVICINIIITVVYLITLMTNLLVNDSIAKKQSDHDNQNNFIKRISAKVKFIESIVTDNSLKGKVNDLYYTIHSSPIKTESDVAEYEEKIEKLLSELENYADKDVSTALNKIEEIYCVLNKRNLLLKSK